MGSLHVVLVKPRFRRLAGFAKRLEEPAVQTSISEHPVEALVVAVLPGAYPSSINHIHARQPFGVRASSDGAVLRPAEMRRPLPRLGVRSAEVPEHPFLARDVFDPRGNSQRTTGSHAEAGAR